MCRYGPTPARLRPVQVSALGSWPCLTTNSAVRAAPTNKLAAATPRIGPALPTAETSLASGGPADLLAQIGDAAADDAGLLPGRDLGEDGQCEGRPAGLLADGEVALTVAQIGQALLPVQRDGVVDLAADAVGLEVPNQGVALAAG